MKKKLLIYSFLLFSFSLFAISSQSFCEDTEKPTIVCKNGLTLPVVSVSHGECVDIFALCVI